jgi:hypothetical protein
MEGFFAAFGYHLIICRLVAAFYAARFVNVSIGEASDLSSVVYTPLQYFVLDACLAMRGVIEIYRIPEQLH